MGVGRHTFQAVWGALHGWQCHRPLQGLRMLHTRASYVGVVGEGGFLGRKCLQDSQLVGWCRIGI
eukprot:scaffold64553_cov36-Cyclotella_meneghiniana.AAC.4